MDVFFFYKCQALSTDAIQYDNDVHCNNIIQFNSISFDFFPSSSSFSFYLFSLILIHAIGKCFSRFGYCLKYIFCFWYLRAGQIEALIEFALMLALLAKLNAANTIHANTCAKCSTAQHNAIRFFLSIQRYQRVFFFAYLCFIFGMCVCAVSLIPISLFSWCTRGTMAASVFCYFICFVCEMSEKKNIIFNLSETMQRHTHTHIPSHAHPASCERGESVTCTTAIVYIVE